MKKITLIVSLVITTLMLGTIQKASAQYYYYDNDSYDSPLTFEIGASVGAMNCLTDIGGRVGKGKNFLKDYNIGNSQLSGSIYVSGVYKYAVGLRLEATLGNVKAYDSILQSVAASTSGRYERNLSFRSKINEFAIVAEIYPLFLFTDWATKDREPPKFSPYLLGGIGFFSFKPQTEYNGAWVDLQPLHTEGQGNPAYPNRKPYKLNQTNYPLGFGLKYEVTPTINIRAEMMYRVLKTDYLDDVSTRYIEPTLFQEDLSLSATQRQLALALNMRNKNIIPEPGEEDTRSRVNSIRGNPKNNDAYFTFNIKLGFTFGREEIANFGNLWSE